MICKRGIKIKCRKVHFDSLKNYRGDPEVRHSVTDRYSCPPIYEEIPNRESEEDNEDRHLFVIKMTTAESQAARNKAKVTFR